MTKDIEVYLIGSDKEDALENSEIYFHRRDARIMAMSAEFNEENKNVYGTIATVILHDLEQV